MPKYVIEREIPGAGQFTCEDLQGISQKSCGVLDELGTSIQWIHSHVTDDKIYCVYRAPSEDLIREHAEKGGRRFDEMADRLNMLEREIDRLHAELRERDDDDDDDEEDDD